MRATFMSDYFLTVDSNSQWLMSSFPSSKQIVVALQLGDEKDEILQRTRNLDVLPPRCNEDSVAQRQIFRRFSVQRALPTGR